MKNKRILGVTCLIFLLFLIPILALLSQRLHDGKGLRRLVHDTIYYSKDYDYYVHRQVYEGGDDYLSIYTIIHDCESVDTLETYTDRRDYWKHCALYFTVDTVYFGGAKDSSRVKHTDNYSRKCFFIPEMPKEWGSSNQYFTFYSNIGEYYCTPWYSAILEDVKEKGNRWNCLEYGDPINELEVFNKESYGNNIVVIPLMPSKHPRHYYEKGH